MDDVIRPRTRPEGLSVSALEIFWGWELDGREFPVPGHGYPEQDLRRLLRSYRRRPVFHWVRESEGRHIVTESMPIPKHRTRYLERLFSISQVESTITRVDNAQ
jgi:hypothetical protein